MKKLLSLVLAIVLLAGMAVPASAANESPERDDSALTFAEARQKGIPYDKPIDQKTREEMLGKDCGSMAEPFRLVLTELDHEQQQAMFLDILQQPVIHMFI